MNLDELRQTLNTPGWKEGIVNKLAEQQKATLNQLAVFPGARPKPEGWSEAPSDDFLRGYFNGVSFALNHWQGLLDEAESAQTRRAIAQMDDEAPAAGSPYVDGALQPVDTTAAKA